MVTPEARLIKAWPEIRAFLLSVLDRVHARVGEEYRDPAFPEIRAEIAATEPQPDIVIRLIGGIPLRATRDDAPPPDRFNAEVGGDDVILESLLAVALMCVLTHGPLDASLKDELDWLGRDPRSRTIRRLLFTDRGRDASDVAAALQDAIRSAAASGLYSAGDEGSPDHEQEAEAQRELLVPILPALTPRVRTLEMKRRIALLRRLFSEEDENGGS